MAGTAVARAVVTLAWRRRPQPDQTKLGTATAAALRSFSLLADPGRAHTAGARPPNRRFCEARRWATTDL